MRQIARREFVKAGSVMALSLAGRHVALIALPQTQDEEPVSFADTGAFKRDLRDANPEVRPYDLRLLRSAITPREDFFVFHQTTVPTIDAADWKLEVAGLVRRPISVTLQELRDMETQHPYEETVTIECSGNSPAKEAMNGLVSTARWSGVRLATILERCGVLPEAREAVFFGADTETDPASGYTFHHGRSLFVQDAMAADVMIALRMNGEPLPPAHGFPARLVLPGWYGMTQIKWLTRIEWIDQRYEGTAMSRNYHSLHAIDRNAQDPLLVETSISRNKLKSLIARVTRHQHQRNRYRIYGVAWGGRRPLAKVEVRTDDNAWTEARILERGGPHAWSLWSLDWGSPAAGRHTLVSRAVDDAGNLQPTLDEVWTRLKSARENNAQWPREIVIS